MRLSLSLVHHREGFKPNIQVKSDHLRKNTRIANCSKFINHEHDPGKIMGHGIIARHTDSKYVQILREERRFGLIKVKSSAIRNHRRYAVQTTAKAKPCSSFANEIGRDPQNLKALL